MLRVISSVITAVILFYIFSFASKHIGREKEKADANRVRLSVLYYKLGQIFAGFFLIVMLCLYVFVAMETTIFVAITFSFGVLAGTGFLFMAMYKNWLIEYGEDTIRYRSHFGRNYTFGFDQIKKIKKTPTGIVIHAEKAKIIVDYRTIGFESFLEWLNPRRVIE